MTVRKWASGSGKTFLGADRNSNGVKPSVEVKNPDSTEVDVEDLVEKEEEDNQPAPQATPSSKPETKSQEDLQLKKAIEIVSK